MKSSIGIIVTLLLLPDLMVAGKPGLEGTWTFVPSKSTDIASWGNSLPQIDVSTAGADVRVVHNWLDRGKVAYADTFAFPSGGSPVTSMVRSEVWPENWYMGVLASAGDPRTISGTWVQPGISLRVVTRQILRTSQGKISITTTRKYALSTNGKTLTLSEKRSSRPSPVILVFERKEAAK
jgi:hypothetical protein